MNRSFCPPVRPAFRAAALVELTAATPNAAQLQSGRLQCNAAPGERFIIGSSKIGGSAGSYREATPGPPRKPALHNPRKVAVKQADLIFLKMVISTDWAARRRLSRVPSHKAL